MIDYEIVESPERDWPARTRVFVDREYAGQTEELPRSREKHWTGRVPIGNRLVRLERSSFPRVWDWQKAPADDQPEERFVRVKQGRLTIVRLKLTDQGHTQTLDITDQPLPAE